MAEKINQNQFAKLVGKSRQAISQLIQKEVIPITKKNGKRVIDLSNKEVKAYINSVKERTENNIKKTIPVKEVKPKELEKIKSIKDKKQKNIKIYDLSNLPTSPNTEKERQKEKEIFNKIVARLDAGENLKASEIIFLPKVTVEKIKLYEMTKQITQKRKQERGELVSRKFIRVTLGKLFEIHINEFLTLKSKVIPDIAGVFGSTDDTKKLKAEKIIDGELWEVLKHIKMEFNKYLEKVKADAID